MPSAWDLQTPGFDPPVELGRQPTDSFTPPPEVPEDYIVELKSLKYYLMSFEDARISHEEVTAKVWQDLADVLYPDLDEEEAQKRLHVAFDVNPRGGISSQTWVGGIQ